MARYLSRRGVLKATAKLAVAGSVAGEFGAIARAEPRPEHNAKTFAHVDTALRAAVSSGEVPGVVALCATENGIVYEGVFGQRRLHEGPAMTRDTVFRIASMVKLITTVAAMQLVEQGKLALDAPVPDIEPMLSAPQVLEGFRRRRKAEVAPGTGADPAASSPHAHLRLCLPALGRQGHAIFAGDHQAAGGATTCRRRARR